MASKKTPSPAQEKPVPDTAPPAAPPSDAPSQEEAPPEKETPAETASQTLVLQERIADLAGGRVVRATPSQAKSLMAGGKARKASAAQIANQAGRIPALSPDTPLTSPAKD